jgi:hypothetical protein
VDVRHFGQLAVQPRKVAVGYAYAVHQDVGGAGSGVRAGPLRLDGGIKLSLQTTGFNVPATTQYHQVSIPPEPTAPG